MRRSTARAVSLFASIFAFQSTVRAQAPASHVFGYEDFSQQAKWDHAFMEIPSAKLAGEELKTLTAAPHWASSPEDHQTALYVAEKFRAAGLHTEIQPFRVWLNKPVTIEIEAFDASGKKLMSGPTPEHVDPKAYGGDPFQNDPRILPAFNGSSPSGDVTADVVYADFGTLEDFKKLASLGISVKGKIVLVRYGGNFRGVKVYIAQQYGAAGVLIYSDPGDDGYVKGDMYPRGPYRPETGVQRGSVQFLPLYPGDPETPGVASTPDLPDSARITDPAKMNQPSIPAIYTRSDERLKLKSSDPAACRCAPASLRSVTSWPGFLFTQRSILITPSIQRKRGRREGRRDAGAQQDGMRAAPQRAAAAADARRRGRRRQRPDRGGGVV